MHKNRKIPKLSGTSTNTLDSYITKNTRNISHTDISKNSSKTTRFAPENDNVASVNETGKPEYQIMGRRVAESIPSLQDKPNEKRNQMHEGPSQPHNRQFPFTNDRRFCEHWFQQFTWLEYYFDVDRAFCFPCRIFKDDTANGCAEKFFTEIGFQNWKKGPERFKKHESSLTHKRCREKLYSLKVSIEVGSIASQLDSLKKKEREENIEYLKEVCKSLLFCARQGISLRGHNEKADSKNRGNFLELMTLRAGDNKLIDKMYKRKEKAWTYTSKEIQEELVNIMAKQVITKILKEIKQAKLFAVIADETSDIAHNEQVSIAIRYVDTTTFAVKERFLGFFTTEKMDGEALSKLIKTCLDDFDLPLNNLRAQCYDGASNMRGEFSGVAARILKDNSLAFYVHCYAHILNLCVVASCSGVTEIRNVLGILNELHNFIDGSSKRNNLFRETLKNKDFFGGNSTLKSLCDTRWSCRIEACNSILDNFDQIVETLEKISDTDKRNGTEANCLLLNITNFKFIFCLLVLQKVLTCTNQLSKCLQEKSINFVTVAELATATKECLNDFRSDDSFIKVWKYVEDICVAQSFNGPQMPRRRKVPQKLGEGSTSAAANVQDYFKTEIMFPVLDIAINSISERFKENDLSILQAISEILSGNAPDKSIFLACETYKINENMLRSELLIFNKMVKIKENDFIATNNDTAFQLRLKYFVEKDLKAIMPCLGELFQILLTIPVSSASCERSFSALRRLKNYNRSTIGQDRLRSLAILNVENEVEVKLEDVIKQFSLNKDRRLVFSY